MRTATCITLTITSALFAVLCGASAVSAASAPGGGAASSTAARTPEQPLFDLTLGEGKRLRERFNTGFYGVLCEDPLVAEGMAMPLAMLDDSLAQQGLPPLSDLCNGLASLRLAVLGMLPGPRPEPLMHLQLLTSPGLAEQVWGLARLRAASSASTAQGDPALTMPGDPALIAVRRGTSIVLAHHGVPSNTVAMPAPAHDLALHYDMAATIALIEEQTRFRQGNSTAERAGMQVAFALMRRLGQLAIHLDLVRGGSLETWTWKGRTAANDPVVDRALLGRMPVTTLMLASLACDGASLYDAIAQALARPGASSAAAIAEADTALAGFGVDGGLEVLLRGVRGTALFSLGSGLGLPTANLVLPRSSGIDQLVTGLLGQLGSAPPPVGESVIVPLPGVQVPVTLCIARDAGSWLLTTDTMLPATWLAGTPGGYLDSPPAKAALAAGPATQAWLLCSSDTASLLRTATGLLALVPIPPDGKQQATRLLTRLAAKADTGYMHGSSTGTATVLSSRGVLTPLSTVALMTMVGSTQARLRRLPAQLP